jgi:putative hydrolase of the HAD superfamily
MEGIKNLLFDFGGVIVGLDKSAAVKRFKEIGANSIEDYLNEFRQTGIFLELEEGKISLDEFHNKFRDTFGENISDEEIDSGWMSFLTYIPEYKLELLDQLRKTYKVYLLSNTNPVISKWAHSKEFSPSGRPIDSYFDKCYLSFEIGCAKPEAGIYEFVISDSGINPSETLFFDDGQSNLDAAAKFGFKTRLVNQEEDLRKIFEKE